MPWIEWRGNSIRVRWYTGAVDPHSGKPLTESKSSAEWTEDEAYNHGLDRESDIRNDRYVAKRDGALLMSEFCRTWPDTLEVGHLRERNVRSMLRLYIVPRWGETAVGDIKTSAYRAWKKQLKDQSNIGDKYAEEILTVFSMLMDDAVDDGLRTSSPVPKGKKRRGKYKKKPRERKREMSIEQVHQLALNAAAYWGLAGYVFMYTMPFTGMRPAELYALRRVYAHPDWPASDPLDDPDEADREERHKEDLDRYGPSLMPALRVQWQHQREEGVLGVYPPKYESRRSLVVPRFLAELLELLADSHDGEYVFRAVSGGMLANANFTYTYWRPVADGRDAREEHARRQHGRLQSVRSRRPVPALPATAYAGKRLYLLRHGHKEWIDEDGHSRVATETRMGHEVAGVEGLYANVTVAMERAMMDTLQRRWMEFAAVQGRQLWECAPTVLPPVLSEWLQRQVTEAESVNSSPGS